MSVQAMAWVFDRVPPDVLTPIQRLVLLSIANHADKYGRNAWPSVDTIAAEAGTRRRTTVKEALRWLRDAGWIEVEVQRGGNLDTRPDRRPNRYSLPLMVGENPGDNSADGGPLSGPPMGNGGPVCVERGAGLRANGGPQTGPLTTHEPSLNARRVQHEDCSACDGSLVTPDGALCQAPTLRAVPRETG